MQEQIFSTAENKLTNENCKVGTQVKHRTTGKMATIIAVDPVTSMNPSSLNRGNLARTPRIRVHWSDGDESPSFLNANEFVLA